MQSTNQASAPEDGFDKAMESLREFVASAQREHQRTSDGEPSEDRVNAAADGLGAQPGGFAGIAPGGQEHRGESFSSHQGRLPRLTDVLANGIHEVTQHVGELIDANRAAHVHLFGPLSLPPRPGGPRPGASTATADGHLAGAMWQLRESIKELQDVSHALLSRI